MSKKNVGEGNVIIEKDYDEKDFTGNKNLAEFLAKENGDDVRIRKHVQKDNVSNPELEINGRLADRKTPNHNLYKNVSSPIKNLTAKAQKQGAIHTVIELSRKYDKESIVKGVKDAFFYAKKMEIIDIILKNKKIARITRKNYENNTIFKVLSDNWID
ncbi:MAG: hypothetical protein LBR08_00760 [Bacteroidales bacterium]|nr:hypothetical protein [Bacteroidales bacterium]